MKLKKINSVLTESDLNERKILRLLIQFQRNKDFNHLNLSNQRIHI